jgi:phage FluMu protein Com
MNSTFCWHCGRPFEYDGEKYRDVKCPFCGVENSIYNPADHKPMEKEEETEMPNLNDMSNFLKRDDIKAGDTLTFTDAGQIAQVDFSKTKDGSGVKTVFQIGIELPDGRNKIITLNKASQTALSEKYSKITEEWLGKKAVVSFVEQMAFGKLTEVLILKPIE